MSFKITYLASRNPNLKPEEFPEAWRSHSRLASTLVNTLGTHFTRVRQAIKIYDANVPPAYKNDHDGVAILNMKSWENLMKARYHKDSVTTMYDDEPRVFATYCENFTMAAEESLYFDRSEGTTALLHYVMRRKDVPPHKFAEVWNNDYVKAVTDLDVAKEATGFALNRIINTPGPAYDFAGMSELWFDDEAKSTAAAWNKDHQAAMKTLDPVIDTSKTVSMLIRLNHQKKIGAGL
jgi:hypothetical protein